MLFALPASMLLILIGAALSGAAAAGWFTLRPLRVKARLPQPPPQVATTIKVLEAVIQPDTEAEFAQKAG